MRGNDTEIIIVGAGIVGLSLAYQLIKRGISKDISILEKESSIGLHTSGRNSGVLHSGIYYPPKSLKGKVCKKGSNRLKEWIKERNLPINNCGKIILPCNAEQDLSVDLLASRGKENGTKIEIIDNTMLKSIIPHAVSVTGRSIWVPSTSVVKPLTILKSLKKELIEKGVNFYLGEKEWKINFKKNKLILKNQKELTYRYFINCAGLHADKIAHKFEIGNKYTLLPFKGIYWKLKNHCIYKPKCNLYPMPDLNLPFLGVHFTPSADKNEIVTIGPTATPAFGSENYNGLVNIEPLETIKNLTLIAKQYLQNKGGFRKYVHEQALLAIPQIMIESAKKLLPPIKIEDIESCDKVGIRAQLYNKESEKLENDFICLNGKNSIHILNAISPAFTSSFELADLIIDKNFLILK